MTIEIKVPALPESVSDATVAKWHKKVGESVKRDENLVDLETDKVMLEVPAPESGVLEAIDQEEGNTVTADQVLGKIEAREIEESARPEAEEDQEREREQPEQDEAAEAAGEAREEPAAPSADERAERQGETGGAPSPSARRLAAEHDVDTGEVPGTGRGGRITKPDIQRFLSGAGARPEERVRMSRIRARIAERMKEAQNTAAILTSFNEIDLQAVTALRRQYKELFAETHDVRLGFMSFFVSACCKALQKHPIVNASVEGEEIVYHGYQDIGVAVSTERGLVVPVLRNAHLMPLAEIERQIRDFVKRANEGGLKMEELQGGTFTITNGGVFGSLLSTPLLNPPQSAILGMHAIKQRPVVLDGEITVRPMMYVALSYDHRIIDGRDAVLFLVTVKELLEDPARLLLDV